KNVRIAKRFENFSGAFAFGKRAGEFLAGRQPSQTDRRLLKPFTVDARSGGIESVRIVAQFQRGYSSDCASTVLDQHSLAHHVAAADRSVVADLRLGLSVEIAGRTPKHSA